MCIRDSFKTSVLMFQQNLFSVNKTCTQAIQMQFIWATHIMTIFLCERLCVCYIKNNNNYCKCIIILILLRHIIILKVLTFIGCLIFLYYLYFYTWHDYKFHKNININVLNLILVTDQT